MEIHVLDRQKDLAIDHVAVRNLVRAVLAREQVSCDEMAIHFVGSEEISKLHDRYFGDPSLTDCISFPIDPPGSADYCMLGEIFVCPKAAIGYAHEHSLDPYHETTLYIVHGILHLLGYDDLGDAEPEMRRAERLNMDNLEKLNLILSKKET